MGEGDAGDKRFDRGKQVLSVMIGVLGTIVGFYFGSVGAETKTGQQGTTTEQAQTLTIPFTTLPDGTVGTPYSVTLKAAGGVPPLKWSVKEPLPDGLVLESATGIISGTPKMATKATYTFIVADNAKQTSKPAILTLEIK
jgi:hypothetical protein